ncbi:class I SAM-dependent methyltransferase [Bacillus cabrialesii subsp. cabrialesii]|uniref:class I SAM-dependent methyltransferase n=1 Tax=Bacillus cabrialesii TaxID=2487276 RepID=UPI0033061292
MNRKLNWNHPDADRYEETIKRKIPGYDFLYDMMDRLLTEKLSEREDILVVGAGGGKELVTLGTGHPGWRFTGVDTSGRMLDAARRRMEGMEIQADLIEGDINHLTFDRVFSGATCMLVLHFLRDLNAKRELLKHIADQLQSGAPFLLASINGDVHSSSFQWQMQAWRQHFLANGISEEEWETFAESIGVSTHPIPEIIVEELLRESGFTGVTRFFNAYAIGGWFAVKGGDTL